MRCLDAGIRYKSYSVKRFLQRLILFSISGVVAALLAEGGARLFLPTEHVSYLSWYENSDRERVRFDEEVARGIARHDLFPHGRPSWTRAAAYHLCYRDNPRSQLDLRGCVPVRFNRLGLRDREELTYEKPPDHRRVLCIGDSFTMCWGVRAEDGWVRQIESRILLPQDLEAKVRTINAGGPWSLFVDEYRWGLENLFHQFQPDAVLVTICLNDLAPMPDTLGWFRRPAQPPGWLAWSRLIGAIYSTTGQGPRLARDPKVDWGRRLLELPDSRDEIEALSEADLEAWIEAFDLVTTRYESRKRELLWAQIDQGLFAQQGMLREQTWRRGGPQEALRGMHEWCEQRGIRFGIVVWPLFQETETLARYPFTAMHRVVTDFADEQGIPVLDLLPEFLGQAAQSLWADPSDQHANEIAHRIATPPIARFTGDLLR